MIWPAPAAQLALTKLKTRKVRLFITLIIASILFSLILAASFVARGAVGGLEKFSRTGFGNRYFAAATSDNQAFFNSNDPSLIAKAEALQKQLQDQKAAEAKKLNLQYDPKTDTPYVQVVDTPGGQQKFLNLQDPKMQQLVATSQSSKNSDRDAFNKLAESYGASAEYASTGIAGLSGPPYLQVLKDGQENFSQQTNNFSQNGIDSLSTQWQLMDGTLMNPFLLNGQNLAVGSDGSIPVIAPFSAVEQILGIKPLPSSASAKQRLARLKQIRQQAAGYSFTACYRNPTSAQDVQNAIQQQLSISQSKGTAGYQLPDFIQDKPSKACGAVVTTRDTRTAAEKQQAANQLQFDQDFGQPPAKSQIIKYRIVGLNADLPTSNAALSIEQVFQAVLQSSLGLGWFTPSEAAQAQPLLADIFPAVKSSDKPVFQQTYYAEFHSPAQLKKFIDEQNCQPSGFGPNTGADFDPFKKCKDAGKYFMVGPFGSSAAALDSFKKDFAKVFTLAAAGVAVLAAIIMMGTVGRIIADSRRETAVFRAIGAKRGDIAQIYLAYVVILALLIFVVSLLIGFVIAYFINRHYAESITVDALLAFNVNDLSQKIVLSRFYWRDVLYVGGLVLGGAILASVFPILNNIRRNPIRDMRDER